MEQLLDRTQAMEHHLGALEETLTALVERLDHHGFDQDWYTVGEVAQRSGKSSFTIRVHYINSGKLQARKTANGRWLIHRDELRRLLQNEL